MPIKWLSAIWITGLMHWGLNWTSASQELWNVLHAPEAVVEEVTVIEPAACSQELDGVVRFTINSAVVSNEEMVNVYNIAQWMKSNPSCNISVIGYADKATGTPEYNKQLSQRRAESVVKLLTEKYNIDRKRIQIIANGSDSQLYPKNNNWNRIVVFSGSAQ